MNTLDEKEFCEEMVLSATREDRDPAVALDIAFADFQRRRRREELDAFDAHRKSMILTINGDQATNVDKAKVTHPRLRRPTPLPLPAPSDSYVDISITKADSNPKGLEALAETSIDVALTEVGRQVSSGGSGLFATIPGLSSLKPSKDD